MLHDPLVSVAELAARLGSADAAATLVLDCGFDLADHAAGQRAFAAGHIPGAAYVSLETALSAPKTGRNGRHPLPTREAFVAILAALGADDDTLVVAYDNAGSMYAARLWWMLRWVGHAAAAVLDGGFAAWKAAGQPVSDGTPPPRRPGTMHPRPALATTVAYADVLANIEIGSRLVVDARAADRFCGENETLDPVGGHIPGAANRPFRDNLGADGRFKPAAQLREQFGATLAGRAPAEVIHQCGSGVTACHNLLAMEVAGLGGSALYPGSWSEWCAQPGAPMATGA